MLKLCKRKNSEAWYLRGSVRGISVFESTQTGNREAAEAICVKRENELLNRSVFGTKATVKFEEAALAYMENGGEARFMMPLLKHFKGRKLAEIGQHDIDAAARAIYPNGGPATRNRQLYTPMSSILKFAARRHWCDSFPLDRPKQPTNRIRWLTVSEAEKLVQCASPHAKPVLRFLFGTGARISEALDLQWADVDLAQGKVLLRETKNGESRSVPMPSSVVADLANLSNRLGPVFLTNKGKPYQSGIKKTFATACRKAGITDFTPHDCRHTFATWHYAKNRDLAQLMALLGHKSVEMTMRYTHANVGNLADGVNKLGW